MKKYRVCFEDPIEDDLGFWWYCYLDNNGCLQDYNYPDYYVRLVPLLPIPPD
jgi:hypothetical protein